MSTISNKFFVTALEDGTTLHGALRSDKALVQSNNNGACIPDWSVAANQPTIYVSLLNGATPTSPDAGGTWSYNGTIITFNSTTHLSTNEGFAGVFLETTKTIDAGGNPISVPAIKIVGNLATLSDIVDMDIITYTGSKTMSVAPLPFSATIEVRITKWISGGYIGVLSFVDGIADITQKGQSIKVTGTLYNDGGSVSHTKEWYVNETLVPTSSTSSDDVYIDNGDLVVKEQGVVDYATVRCDFKVGNDVVYTSYVGIDDTQDPEYMYVQVASGSGNSASLRSGESVTFKVWVGTMDDPTPNPLWNSFKVKLLDAEGNVITAATYSGETVSDGYRVMALTDSGGQFFASYTLTYDFVADMTKGKKSITGIIIGKQITDVAVDDEA